MPLSRTLVVCLAISISLSSLVTSSVAHSTQTNIQPIITKKNGQTTYSGQSRQAEKTSSESNRIMRIDQDKWIIPVQNTIQQQLDSGIWDVAWEINGYYHQGRLCLNTANRALVVTVFGPPNSGTKPRTIWQRIVVEPIDPRGNTIYLLGSDPLDLYTLNNVVDYAPDNLRLEITGQGLSVVEVCDSNGICANTSSRLIGADTFMTARECAAFSSQ